MFFLLEHDIACRGFVLVSWYSSYRVLDARCQSITVIRLQRKQEFITDSYNSINLDKGD